MRKILLLFGLIVLLGTGCGGAQETEKTLIEPEMPENEVSDYTDSHDDENMADEDEMDSISDMPCHQMADGSWVGDCEDEESVDDNMIDEANDNDSEEEANTVEVEEDDSLESLSITMESGNFFFKPDSMNAAPGQVIEITFSKNSGVHTFVIDEMGVRETVSEGGTISFTAPDEMGSYAFYCDIGNHRAMGMEGVLTVQ
jgi:plastocyanin